MNVVWFAVVIIQINVQHMMTDDVDNRLREALRSFRESDDIAGLWTLDQFILRRNARVSADTLKAVAKQIDGLEARKRHYAAQMDAWSAVAFLSGFVALSTLFNSWQFYRSPWLWGACVGMP